MKIKELAERCGLQTVTCPDLLEESFCGCYIGDLLSWAMSKVQEGEVWLTVMGNINTIAVASLSGAACVVLVDGAQLDADAKAKAEQQEILVLTSEQTAYALAKQIAAME